MRRRERDDGTGLLVGLCLFLALASCEPADAQAPRFDARETVRRAQIGTHSPRVAPPVRTEPAPPKGHHLLNPPRKKERRK